jgi:hypothetical protein
MSRRANAHFILSAIWASGGTGNAPDPDDFPVGSIGADNDGASTAATYHVVNVAGTKTWIATGGTVANLYGG